MHLRNTSERIRVLHILLRLLHNLAALKQLAHACRRSYLSLVWTHLMNGIYERSRQSVVSVERHCSNPVCPFAQPVRLQQRPHGKGTHVLRTVEQRQPLFRGKLYWLPLQFLQHLGSCDYLALVFHLTKSYERKREMSQRYQVARSSERALHVHHWIDIIIEEIDESVDGDELTARKTVAQRLNLEQQHYLHNVVWHTVARTASVRHHEVYLQLRQIVLTDAHIAERSESGSHAIDGRSGLFYLSVEIFSAFHYAFLCVVAQLYLVAAVYYFTYAFNRKVLG